MSQLNEEQQRQLVRDLVTAVEKFAPEWTDSTSSDLGITLLQLFSWLFDALDYRVDRISAAETDLLKTLIAKLVATCPGTCATSGLTRPRYFYGKLLAASDFEEEQDYVRKALKRQNRCILGTGIVNGLGVSLDAGSSKSDNPTITITPGCAIAPDGQLLCICDVLRCVMSTQGSAGYIVLRYSECAIDPVPTLTPSGTTEYSRIEEGVAAAFEQEPLGDAVAIARLSRKAGRWTLDRKFRPQRIAARPS